MSRRDRHPCWCGQLRTRSITLEVSFDGAPIGGGRLPVCDAHVQLSTWPEELLEEIRDMLLPDDAPPRVLSH